MSSECREPPGQVFSLAGDKRVPTKRRHLNSRKSPPPLAVWRVGAGFFVFEEGSGVEARLSGIKGMTKALSRESPASLDPDKAVKAFRNLTRPVERRMEDMGRLR